MKNEPNLRQNELNSNQSNAVPACSSATLLTYSGQTLRKKCCASSSLRPKQQTFSQSRKNEPKTNPIYADSNPICEKNTKIYALSNYNFSQLPYVDLCEGGTFRQKKYNFSQLFDQKICKTNPILKTLK